MKMQGSLGMSLAMVAGLACSVATAQSGDIVPHEQSKVKKVQRGPRDGGEVRPIRVEVDGVSVPFSVVEGGGGGAADLQSVVYENLGTTNFIVAASAHALDDFAFAGGPALIRGFRPAFGTPAAGTAAPSVNVTIEAKFFGGYNPAVTPVSGPPNGNAIRVTYAFPTGGWAANTVYTGAAFIIHGAASIGPTVSSGCVDIRVLNATTLVNHVDIRPAFCGGGVTIGTSADNAFIDNNNDGIIQGADAGAGNEATGPGAGAGFPGFANLRVAIQGQTSEPAVGACCVGGSCVVLPQTKCTNLAGVYNGDGSTCDSVAGHCVTPPLLHSNGPMITGPTTLNGTPAPAGSNWAEGAQEGACSSQTNGPNGSGTFRLSDDFTVPAGKQWVVTNFTAWAYASPGSTTTNPITGMTLRIWNGPPNVTGSAVIAGDATTNLLPGGTSVWDNLYRCFNTGLLGQVPGTTRPVWKHRVPFSVTLPAGTYWADWGFTGATFSPQVTLMTNSSNGVLDLPRSNALQFLATAPAPNTGNGWQPIGGNGAQASCFAEIAEMPFIVEGTESNVGGCYANCDGSSGNPLLTANDFQCFINKFAANDPYANCDGSTGIPALTANDFQCFINKYAGGCS